MLVVPGRCPHRPSARGDLPDVLRDVGRAPRDRRVRDRGPARDARHAGDPPRDRVRLPPARRRRRPRISAASRAYRAVGVRGEAQAGARGGPDEDAGRGLERGHVPVAATGDPAALGRYTGLLQSLGPMSARPQHAGPRLRGDPARRVHRPRGHGGRGAQRPGRDGLDGRRLVRPRVVDGAARGDRRARRRRRSCRPGRRSQVERRRPRRPPRRRAPRRHRPAGAR